MSVPAGSAGPRRGRQPAGKRREGRNVGSSPPGTQLSSPSFRASCRQPCSHTVPKPWSHLQPSPLWAACTSAGIPEVSSLHVHCPFWFSLENTVLTTIQSGTFHEPAFEISGAFPLPARWSSVSVTQHSKPFPNSCSAHLPTGSVASQPLDASWLHRAASCA